MINVNNVSYTVIVITEKKLQLNITQAVEELGWEENEDELATKIHFNMYNALYNKHDSSAEKGKFYYLDGEYSEG